MDPKFSLCFLFLLSSTFFITIQGAQPYKETNLPKPSRINVEKIATLLSDKGYHAMSLTLEITLQDAIQTQFITHNSTITLFCPQDQAFFTSNYPQPPLTLLKYHLVPFKIEKDTFKASNFGHGSKIDTLLRGHPLVLTSLPGTNRSYASLNQVKVTEWDLYNDGRVIVHGLEDFFDPAFQTLRYPQYDSVVVNEVPSLGLSNWLKATENWLLLLLLVAASIFVLILLFIFCAKPSKQDDVQYSPL